VATTSSRVIFSSGNCAFIPCQDVIHFLTGNGRLDIQIITMIQIGGADHRATFPWINEQRTLDPADA
jgi:hypothetical protein